MRSIASASWFSKRSVRFPCHQSSNCHPSNPATTAMAIAKPMGQAITYHNENPSTAASNQGTNRKRRSAKLRWLGSCSTAVFSWFGSPPGRNRSRTRSRFCPWNHRDDKNRNQLNHDWFLVQGGTIPRGYRRRARVVPAPSWVPRRWPYSGREWTFLSSPFA
jgi:hypothetical protein